MRRKGPQRQTQHPPSSSRDSLDWTLKVSKRTERLGYQGGWMTLRVFSALPGLSTAPGAGSGFINAPALPPPMAPAIAPIVPPTNTPTGPATTAPTAAPAAEPATSPPPISTDFDSRSASWGLSATCAAELGSCDGTPWPGTACSARSGSAGFTFSGNKVGDEFMFEPW